MPYLRTSLSQFALVDGRRRNHTESVACREPSRLPFGPPRSHLYLLAEHAAANGHEHRFCQKVMQEVQLAFAAEESAGPAVALTRAIQLVNQALWEGGQELPPHKRLPIGLVALAIDGAEAYLCQIATGQIFISRGEAHVSLPELSHWRDLHAGAIEPTPALGQTPALTPRLARCRLAPGDLIVLGATNLARLIDLPTLSRLAAQPTEAVVTHLCTLAEDFGLLHTSGMTLRILATPGPAAVEPLRLDFLTPVLVEETAARHQGLADRLSHLLRRGPAGRAAASVPAPAVVPDDPDGLTAPAPAEERLPENVVRLYTTPPLAALAEPAPVAAPPAAARPAPEVPPDPAPGPRPRRTRWLDALAASMVLATEPLRRAAAPPPRPVAARRSPRRPRPVGATRRPAAPEPVYRAAGDLTPAAAGGPAPAIALRMAALRWPTGALNSALIVAMALLATVLVLAATLNSALRPSWPLPFRAEPAGAATVSAPAAAAPAQPAAPLTSERTLAYLIASRPPVEAAAPPAAASDASERMVTNRGAAAAAIEAETQAGRLGPVTVLADLSASGTPASTPKQLIAGRGNLYVLDPYTSTLYLLDPAGKPPTPLLSRGWSIGREKVTDLLGATWRGDTLVVMDRQRAYTLDGPNGTWRVAPLAAAGLAAGVHPVASYDGGLYILDSANSKVLKFAQGAYQKPPQPWLKPQEKVDLSGAVDIAIDGHIYALTASGHLLILYRGGLEKRQLIEVTPALQAPAALVSPANSHYLYVAEAGGRILKLTKDGVVVAQLRPAEGSADLAGLSDLWVDEATQTIYAVAGNRVVRLGLPDSSRPRAAIS